MKKILIEASSIAQVTKTGVGFFAEHLAEAMEHVSGEFDVEISYLWLNFLRRRQPDSELLRQALVNKRINMPWFMPQRVYAKLVLADIAPPLLTRRKDWVFFPNFYLWPVAGARKKAVIIHDLCFMRYPEFVEDKNRNFLNVVAKRAMKKADLIVTNSKFTASEIVSMTDVPKERIVSINVPVDPKRFAPERNMGMAHMKKFFGVSKKYILTMGTIEPRKNLEVLVEGYCTLPSELRDNYSLVIAGGWGWKTESIRKLVEAKQSAGFDIITIGHVNVEHHSTIYRNASTFAITAYYEGFGMPLLEALHCGLPSLAVDIPVLREVAGEACLFVERDKLAVASGLEKLLTNKPFADKLRKQGPERAKLSSWDESARTLLQRMVGKP